MERMVKTTTAAARVRLIESGAQSDANLTKRQ
jgi:hypothetical protein